jgi:hypothetical protein
MSKQRNGHVLKLSDGSYFIEEAPYKTDKLDEAEIYFKYFDLIEAQARAQRNTGLDAQMQRITFIITLLTKHE